MDKGTKYALPPREVLVAFFCDGNFYKEDSPFSKKTMTEEEAIAEVDKLYNGLDRVQEIVEDANKTVGKLRRKVDSWLEKEEWEPLHKAWEKKEAGNVLL